MTTVRARRGRRGDSRWRNLSATRVVEAHLTQTPKLVRSLTGHPRRVDAIVARRLWDLSFIIRFEAHVEGCLQEIHVTLCSYIVVTRLISRGQANPEQESDRHRSQQRHRWNGKDKVQVARIDSNRADVKAIDWSELEPK